MVLVALKIVLVIGVMCFDSWRAVESMNSVRYTATATAMMATKRVEAVFIDPRLALYTAHSEVCEKVPSEA